jgi:hypothetical protein
MAEYAQVGVFDLRYTLGLMRKNPLQQKEVSALRVHLARCARRFDDEGSEQEPFTEDTDMEAVIDEIIEEQEREEEDAE